MPGSLGRVARILIIGGGVGGLAVALALHKAGAEPVVCEAHPDSGQDLGAFLTLASNGMLALAQVDAARVVAETGFPLTTMRVVADTGAEIATVPLGLHEDALTRYRCLRRAELLAKALRDAPSMEAALATYELLRRPRVEHNIANSARLTAGRAPDTARRRSAGPAGVPDEELVRQLEWAGLITD